MLRIRIRIHRIHVFLGLLDPDPNPFIIKQKWWEKSWFLLFCDFFLTFYLWKITFLLAFWRSMMKIEGSGSASGSISQRHGSAGPDPDRHQNVMDPQHCISLTFWLVNDVLLKLRSRKNFKGAHNLTLSILALKALESIIRNLRFGLHLTSPYPVTRMVRLKLVSQRF